MKTKVKTIQELLSNTGRKQYVDEGVLRTSPKSEINTNIEFFRLDRQISNKELEAEYENRDLQPANIASLCAYDIENPKKIDEMKWVASCWKDSNSFNFVAFSRWDGERGVGVNRNDFGWDDGWWFAGLRKFSPSSSETMNSLDTLNLEFIESLKNLKVAIENTQEISELTLKKIKKLVK